MSGFRMSFVMLAILVATVSADTYITYYEHTNHQGASNSWTLPGNGECVNLAGFNDRISSVNTHGGCAILFEHGHCQGRGITVAPGTGCHSKLSDCNFNDVTSSMKAC